MAAATAAAAVAAVAMDRGAATVEDEVGGLGPGCLFGCCCCCAAEADADAEAEEEMGACGCWRQAAKNVERKKDEERVWDGMLDGIFVCSLSSYFSGSRDEKQREDGKETVSVVGGWCLLNGCPVPGPTIPSIGRFLACDNAELVRGLSVR